jgi:hypothetical protein
MEPKRVSPYITDGRYEAERLRRTAVGGDDDEKRKIWSAHADWLSGVCVYKVHPASILGTWYRARHHTNRRNFHSKKQ